MVCMFEIYLQVDIPQKDDWVGFGSVTLKHLGIWGQKMASEKHFIGFWF